jgi:Uma2 family endonuclease
MVAQPTVSVSPQIVYPEDDGKPMSENTKQFRWIVTIKENLEILFAADPNVFVAGDLLWYPVEDDNKRCQAPDILVVMGRPKGDRSSYQQWLEDNIAPQVVFEILSPSNKTAEMTRKLLFYQEHGVEEYYVYDPERNELIGSHRISQRMDTSFVEIPDLQGWVSPRLGIRFELDETTLQIYAPNGDRFLSPVELAAQRDQERQRADQERQRADQERQRADRLAAKLREMGIDPDQV